MSTARRSVAPQTLRDLLFEARPYIDRYLAAWVPLVAAYAAVFVYSNDAPFGWALLTALTNITVPILLGLPVFVLLARFVFRASPMVQLAAHMALSLIFTFAWLAILQVELGVITWLQYGVYEPVIFAGPALTWQLFQGLTVYFLVTAGAYVIVMMVRGSYLIAGLVQVPIMEEAPLTNPDIGQERIFVKSTKGFLPLTLDEIVSISGADDYCEVKTPTSTLLVRMTLAAFEDRLDPKRFVRVHRSHIVSLSHVERVEPRSGGRLILKLVGGETVMASRSGAEALQPFLVT